MNLHRGRIELPKLTISGHSTAGIETAICLQEFSLCVDMGVSDKETTRCNHLVFTHGHPDHMGSLIAHLGKRLLYGLPTTRIYGETSLLNAMKELVSAAEKAQGGGLPAEWIPLNPGESVSSARVAP